MARARVMGLQRRLKVPGLRALQHVQMQGNADQHALPEIGHRRHEDRAAGEASIGLDLRYMLVFQAQRVKLEIGRAAGLIGLDHRLSAAGIAGDRVDGDGEILGDEASVRQRAQQRDGAGGVAAGIGDIFG